MSALTKSWLQKAISDIETMRDEIPFGLDEDGNNTLAAFKAALAGMEAEPVAESKIYGPYIPKFIGPAVWAAITDELPPELVDKSVWISLSPQPLTTSERAELENYRNAQQVVPEVRPDWQRNEFSAGWNACRAAMLQVGK